MKRLLVCVDGALPYTESCLKYAEFLIKEMDATADVLYVSDTHQFDFALLSDFSGSLGVQPYQNLYTQLNQVEQEKRQIIQETVEKFFKHAALANKANFKCEHGSLVDICQAYENSEIGIDMILLGKRGENASSATEHLGSNLERVVRASQKPCWIACRQFNPIKKLAFAYDDSPSAHHALQFLIRSAFLKNVSIDLLYANEEGSLSEIERTMLNAAEKALKEAGYSVQLTCIYDNANDGISNYIAAQIIDLLIMGAYGHSAIRYLLIGSTTTDLIRRCKIPVLLFR